MQSLQVRTCVQHGDRHAARQIALRNMQDTQRAIARAYAETADVETISRIRQELIRRRQHFNSLSCISKLPDDVLVDIFSLCLCDHSSRDNNYLSQKCFDCLYRDTLKILRVLGDVCSYWKILVERSPSLWSTILTNQGRSRMKEALSRSKHVPLDVQMTFDLSPGQRDGRHREAVKAFKSIFRRLHRIKVLIILGWVESLDPDLKKYMDYEAPILRRLAVTGGEQFLGRSRTSDGVFRYALPHPCPSLRSLSLDGISLRSIQPSMVPSLQELYATEDVIELSFFREALSILDGLPNLRKVYLAHRCTECLEDGAVNNIFSPEEIVVLHNLESLTLEGCAVHLLDGLRFPNARLQITKMCSSQSPITTVAHHLSIFSSQAAFSDTLSVCIRYEGDPWDSISRALWFEMIIGSNIATEPRTFCFDHSHHESEGEFLALPMLHGLCEAVSSRVKECTISLAPELCGRIFNLDEDVGWSTLLQNMTNLETLHVRSSEREGTAFFTSLLSEDPDLDPANWPLPSLKKMSLQLEEGEDDLDTQEHVAYLLTVLRARHDRGLHLDELKIDVNHDSDLTEDAFTPFTQLVTRMTLNLAPAAPVASDGSRDTSEAGDHASNNESVPYDDIILSIAPETIAIGQGRRSEHEVEAAEAQGSNSNAPVTEVDVDDMRSVCTSESDCSTEDE